MEAIGARTRFRLSERVWPRSPEAALVRRRVAIWVLVPLAIEILAWRALLVTPSPGLDPSWIAGLQMALRQHIAFGTHAIFTYGPLGFLSAFPFMYFGGLWQIAFLYIVLVRFAVAAAIFTSARRAFGPWAAFVIAVVVASMVNAFAEPVVLLIVLVWGLLQPLEGPRGLLLPAAAGAVSAIEIMNKVSIGVTAVVLSAIFVLTLPRDRIKSIVAAAGTFLVVLVVVWAAIGQPLSALPHYLHAAEQVSSGYSSAMSVDTAGLGWAYTAALVVFCLGLWGAVHTTVWAQPRQRVGVVLMWLFFCFSAFKEGFVRFEPGHLQIFFMAALGGFFAFRWRIGNRRVALLATAALVVLTLVATQQSLTGLFNPPRSVSKAFDDARYEVSGSRRASLIAAGRASIIASEPLSPAALRLVQGQTVAIFPYEIALAWAYRLDWRPIPVLQSYTAYTTYLDKLDANFLYSGSAPQRLIVQNLSNTGIDGRVLGFDEPATSRAILCRYKLLLKTSDFVIMGRVPNRCSAPTLIETLRVDWGQGVPVPAPPTAHSLVFVRINGVQISGLSEQLRNLLWKPVQRSIVLDGAVTARLVEAVAGDGLPIRTAAGVDLPDPFNLAVHAKTLAVLKQRSGPTGGRPITYQFYSENVGGS